MGTQLGPQRMSASKVPPFESEAYWAHRFTASQAPFEWLASIDDTTRILDQVIGHGGRQKDPMILHIGCGTSDLAFGLRSYVKWPFHVHNVDFSQRAVDHGRARERELFGNANPGVTSVEEARTIEAGINPSWMRWSKVDLLSFPSVLSLMNRVGGLYDLIVDKSTSDAIACGEQITVQSTLHPPLISRSMHPMEALALHLAAVTVTGGQWVAISYSADRFWFLEARKLNNIRSFDSQGNSFQGAGQHFDPAEFWQLERKEHIPEAGDKGTAHTNDPTSVVHRPQINHWLYVLIRTDVPLPSHLLPAATPSTTSP